MKFPLIIASAAIATMALVSCQVKPIDGMALFDSFEYKGNDDYYNSRMLPSDDFVFNPIISGWYSDPSICTNGKGDYFLATSTFAYFPGVPLFHSRDLVNWEQIGNVLDREEQIKNLEKQSVSEGIFAPDIKYNPANGTYYMITTNVGAGTFFVKTEDPWGSWSDAVEVPEIKGIDPSFFFDDDGKVYILNNDDAPGYKPEYSGHRTIRIREFDPVTEKVCSPEKIIINKGVHPEDKPIWIEGPHMYKISGKYYLMAAEGGTEEGHSEVIFRSNSPWGPFVAYEGNPILTQRDMPEDRMDPITCAGHADLVQRPDGDWWAVFLATRPLDGEFENLGRETFMMPVKWSKDGFPYMTKAGEAVPMVIKVEGARRGSNVTFGNYSRKDDFGSRTLDNGWMTLRSAGAGLYSLEEKPGYLALKYTDKKLSDKGTPAAVLRRLSHHIFEATTTMIPGDGGSAGMVLFKDENHHYTFMVENKDIVVRKGNDILASTAIGNIHHISLKIASDERHFSFSYSTDGGDTYKTLMKSVDAEYLSTAAAGGFTGTTIGLYATK